jgi:DNA-cytosine methyltransferase
MCEIEAAAAAVLGARFPSVTLTRDVLALDGLPECDLIAAGFPCQDLSQAGRTAGIEGRNSGLVRRVFELLEQAEHQPRWLLLENVPFMLQLDRGDAMRYLARRLADLGYRWAYRVVDARAFGLPQRRQRVILLASQTADPREILFHGDCGEPEAPDHAPRRPSGRDEAPKRRSWSTFQPAPVVHFSTGLDSPRCPTLNRDELTGNARQQEGSFRHRPAADIVRSQDCSANVARPDGIGST